MVIEVNWAAFKSFIASSELKWIYIDEPSDSYSVYISYQGLTLKSYIKNGSADCTDFENNYKVNGNSKISAQVSTRSERSNVSMKICHVRKQTDENGDIVIEFKIPGTFGQDKGREIAGGIAFWDSPVNGNKITEINVVDNDNHLGYGAGTVLKAWHDNFIENYQDSGWGMPVSGPLSIQSMGDWGELPAGFYLQIKASGVINDYLTVNLKWAEPS